MSFSWWCKDRDGRDLFEEFGVNAQGFGLGPSSGGDTEAPYRLEDIRTRWQGVPYKDRLEDAARDAVGEAQSLARLNLESLRPHHCETCSCPPVEPIGWSTKEIERFQAVPLDRVWRAGGGR